MNLRPGRVLLHLGQLLLRVGIWLTARWAETALAIAEQNWPSPQPSSPATAGQLSLVESAPAAHPHVVTEASIGISLCHQPHEQQLLAVAHAYLRRMAPKQERARA